MDKFKKSTLLSEGMVEKRLEGEDIVLSRTRAKKVEPGDPSPELQLRYPQNQTIATHGFVRSLTRRTEEDGALFYYDVPIGNEVATTVCMIDIDKCKSAHIECHQPFSEYDWNVYNAVVSLYKAGNELITPPAVYRMMTGCDVHDIGDGQLLAVCKSLDKLRFTRLVLDCTQEFRERGIQLDSQDVLRGMYDTYLLNASAMRARSAGFALVALKLETDPVLYHYAALTDQVLQVPTKMFKICRVEEDADGKLYATEDLVKNNESRIKIKGYLARRVRAASNPHRSASCKVMLRSYQYKDEHRFGLYEVAGYEDGECPPIHAKRIRDYVEEVLRYWIAVGYVSGYKFLYDKKNTRVISGISIEIPPWTSAVWSGDTASAALLSAAAG